MTFDNIRRAIVRNDLLDDEQLDYFDEVSTSVKDLGDDEYLVLDENEEAILKIKMEQPENNIELLGVYI